MKKNIFNQNKRAFSLAEGMVMLVIVSILMALSAPLIAKKASNDAKRLIYRGAGSNTVTAMGDSQNLGVGIINPDAKLTVKSTKSDNSLIAKFESIFDTEDSNAGTVIFQVKPKATGYVNTNGNPDGFQVYAGGFTNAGCFPDFLHKQIINHYNTDPHDTNKDDSCSPAFQPCYGFEAQDNGYILSPRTLIISNDNNWPTVNGEYNDGYAYFQPTTRPTEIYWNNSDNKYYVSREQYVSRVLAPVSKGTKVLMITDCARINGNTCAGGPNIDLTAGADKMSFIPCKK